jgi:hypothetical protein
VGVPLEDAGVVEVLELVVVPVGPMCGLAGVPRTPVGAPQGAEPGRGDPGCRSWTVGGAGAFQARLLVLVGSLAGA